MKIQTSRQFLAKLASRRAARLLWIAPLLGGCALAVSPVQAANTTDLFAPAGTSLLTPGNWSLGTLPTVANDAVFGLGSANSGLTLTAGSLHRRINR